MVRLWGLLDSEEPEEIGTDFDVTESEVQEPESVEEEEKDLESLIDLEGVPGIEELPEEIEEPVMEEFIQLLSQYIKIQLPGQEIDYECFAFSILCFIYMVNLDHHLGRSHCFDHEIGPEKFIDNLTLSLR